MLRSILWADQFALIFYCLFLCRSFCLLLNCSTHHSYLGLIFLKFYLTFLNKTALFLGDSSLFGCPNHLFVLGSKLDFPILYHFYNYRFIFTLNLHHPLSIDFLQFRPEFIYHFNHQSFYSHHGQSHQNLHLDDRFHYKK